MLLSSGPLVWGGLLTSTTPWCLLDGSWHRMDTVGSCSTFLHFFFSLTKQQPAALFRYRSSMPFFCTHHLIKHGYQPMIGYVFTYCACTPGAVVFVHVVTSTGPYDGLLLYFWRIGSGQCSMLLAKLYMVALTLISFVIEESLMMEWMEWTCGTGAYSPRQTLSLLISKSFL